MVACLRHYCSMYNAAEHPCSVRGQSVVFTVWIESAGFHPIRRHFAASLPRKWHLGTVELAYGSGGNHGTGFVPDGSAWWSQVGSSFE